MSVKVKRYSYLTWYSATYNPEQRHFYNLGSGSWLAMTVVPRRTQWQPRACANGLLGPQLQPAGIYAPVNHANHWKVGSVLFVRRHCDCSGSLAPTTDIQTCLLTHCWLGDTRKECHLTSSASVCKGIWDEIVSFHFDVTSFLKLLILMCHVTKLMSYCLF